MVYTGNTNFNYEKRLFDPLPAGYVATDEIDEVMSGVLDVSDTTFVKCGLLVVLSGMTANGIRQFKLPDANTTAAQIAGVLYYDQTNFRLPGQPKYTHTNKDLVSVVRKGHMRVHSVGAITNNAPVYFVKDSTVAGEEPGMLKASASTNATQISNCKWGEIKTITTLTPATLELLGGGFA